MVVRTQSNECICEETPFLLQEDTKKNPGQWKFSKTGTRIEKEEVYSADLYSQRPIEKE